MPSCAVVASLRRKSGSVVDAIDVESCRYRSAESLRVRVGRDTGRLPIGGRKRSPAQSPGRGVALSKFFAWLEESLATRQRYALWATSD